MHDDKQLKQLKYFKIITKYQGVILTSRAECMFLASLAALAALAPLAAPASLAALASSTLTTSTPTSYTLRTS